VRAMTRRATVGAQSTQTMAERTELVQSTQVDMRVRVHTNPLAQADSSIKFQLVSDGFTQEDPGTTFFSSSIGESAEITSATPVGTLLVTTITTKLGAMVALQVVGEQGVNVDAGLKPELSVDLIFKSS